MRHHIGDRCSPSTLRIDPTGAHCKGFQDQNAEGLPTGPSAPLQGQSRGRCSGCMGLIQMQNAFTCFYVENRFQENSKRGLSMGAYERRALLSERDCLLGSTDLLDIMPRSMIHLECFWFHYPVIGKLLVICALLGSLLDGRRKLSWPADKT